jgi:hypothetical protein
LAEATEEDEWESNLSCSPDNNNTSSKLNFDLLFGYDRVNALDIELMCSILTLNAERGRKNHPNRASFPPAHVQKLLATHNPLSNSSDRLLAEGKFRCACHCIDDNFFCFCSLECIVLFSLKYVNLINKKLS